VISITIPYLDTLYPSQFTICKVYHAAKEVISFRLLKNAPAFAEAASRRQADARLPKS
jgi:hypothetical protein